MNSDEIKSLIVKMLLILLGPLATKYGIDGDTQTAIALWIGTGVVLVYGIYDHWNQKKVPETSVAVKPSIPVTPSTTPVLGSKASISGTVVGALLLGFFLCSLAFPAHAQTKTTTPADVVTNLIKNINNIALADLQNAQALANAMPNKVTAPCWTAVVNMVQKQQAILNPPASTTSSSVPPLPSVHIFTDAEKLSEIIQSLQTGGDIQINCAAMADASKKSVLQIVSAIISGASVAPLVPVIP